VVKPIRILAFWAVSDFDDFFSIAFLNRPDLQVEIVSGDSGKKRSPYAPTLRRMRELRKRLEAGDFDLVVSGNKWISRWLDHKGFFTQLSVVLRYSTYKRRFLDADLVPDLLRGLRRPVPLAVLDLRDAHFVLPWDLPLLQAATLYFKRELFAWPRRSLLPIMTWKRARDVEFLQDKLRPLSYGIHPSRIPPDAPPMAQRDIDIFISGTTNPVREEISRRCEALAGKYKVVVATGRVSDIEYHDYLRRSKLVIATESFGCETWRQYDAAAAGAVPLINHPYVLHHCPMEPDEHAIFFSLAGHDFERQVDRALANPGLLQEISTRTRQWTIENKVRARIADYVIRETLAAAKSG
jgi:hypothetical protein